MLHYYVKRYLSVALLLLCCQAFWAQAPHLDKKVFFEADKAFDEGDYLNAINGYQKLYLIDSNNSEVNYKLGACKYEIKKFRKSSITNFEKVVKKDFPEANYYLGLLYHSQNKFDKAIDCYNQYQNEKGEKDHAAKEINDLIIKCYTARLLQTGEDNSVLIENLGSKVNTEYPEYAPLIPADEKFMIFTSRRKNDVCKQTDIYGDYYEDVYMSKKTADGWDTPVMLDTVINTAVHDACTGLSANGEKLLLYRTSKDLVSGDIYESDFVQGKWSQPVIIPANVNSKEYLESSACYSADANIIFFSSNRPGGFGGKDLYYSRRLSNGRWGEPFNLGPKINTEYNEDAPYVDPLGTTIFFSSEGHKNMGGYDVFKSTFNDAGIFTDAENLGCPINTVNDDIFFVLNMNGTIGYLSSEREGGFGSQDIYSVYFGGKSEEQKPFSVHLMDEANAVITKATITLLDPKTNLEMGLYKSNQETGKILIISNTKQKYTLEIEAKGYKTKKVENYSFDQGDEINFKMEAVINE